MHIYISLYTQIGTDTFTDVYPVLYTYTCIYNTHPAHPPHTAEKGSVATPNVRYKI